MKIGLYGYGKMGKTIERLAKDRGHEIVLKINAENADSITPDELRKADVIIEFSRPELAVQHIENCFNAAVPVVVGTTGWYDEYEKVKSACAENNGALLAATNFSVGVNLFFELNKRLAQLMEPHKDYQVAVEEIHHTQKLDAPSGTAITIAEGIIANIPEKNKWVMDKTPVKNELEITAKRLPDVPGTHEVNYRSKIDDISIKHTAHSRDGFALGAIIAAEFIKDKHGIFTMEDVLKL
jgi:4-hydroxy-tetrahydrodipicolinate reductase